jgi:hypothetical protein
MYTVSPLHYQEQPINAVYTNNYHLFWEIYKTQKHTVCAKHSILILKQIVPIQCALTNYTF